MKFNYQARTKGGEIRNGQVEASSKDAAVMLLQKYGFYVTFLEEDIAPIYARKLKIFDRVSREDVVMFSRQLAIMFRSKVPLIESLRVLSAQIKNSDFQEKIIKMSEEVEAGTPFSGALIRHPKVFSSFYVAVVKAGEASGSLAESLNYLADHLEKEYNLTSKVRGALIYPAFVLVVVFAVVLLMFYKIIPSFAAIFAANEAPLPLSTKIVIGMSDFVKKWGLLTAIPIAGLIIAGFRYYRTQSGKSMFDKILLRLPVLGNLFKTVYLTRFAENLSTLFAGGLPIAQALDVVADIIGNDSYKKIILETRDNVRKGERISAALSKRPDLFPPVFVQMILVGERTGTVDTTLKDVVDFYQQEIDRKISGMLSLLEPILIIFLGLVVVGIMLSIFAPLYQVISM